MKYKCVKCGEVVDDEISQLPHKEREVVCVKCFATSREWYVMEQIGAEPKIDKNILEEANEVTHGDRRKDYGTPKDNFSHIAKIYNAITKQDIKAEDIVYMMIATKLARQQSSEKRDNLVDLAGYAWVLGEVQK